MYPQCSQCSFHNGLDAKFCKQCGALLRIDEPHREQVAANTKCQKCSFTNVMSAKFCNQCGSSLEETPALSPNPNAPGTQDLRTRGFAYELGRKWASLPSWARAGAVGAVILFFILIVIGLSSNTSPTSRPASPTSIMSTPNRPAVPPQSQRPSFSDNLSTAKTYLESPVMQDELDVAKRELELIPESAPEYKEAQLLLTQIKNGKIRVLPEIPGFESASSRLYEKFMNVDPSITYEKLKKNVDKYIGKSWGFTGKVLEIYEQGNSTVARVGIGAYGLDAVFVEGNFTTDFVADNRVYVLGDIYGSKTYESQAGWQITIPHIQAIAMLKPSDVAKLQAAKR